MGALEDKPYIVSWNLTRRCNLLCPHCYMEALNSPCPELTEKEARFVIDELSYLNNKLMLVLSGGEPMLREDLIDIVEYASQAGFIVVLGSNGTLLTAERLKVLRDAGLKGVGISIDSSVPAYHDAFRGLKGAWELSLNALRAARSVGLETQLDVTLTDRNWPEIDSIIELGADLGVRAVNFFFLICTGRAMRTDISTDNYDSALRSISERFSRERRLMVRARCAPHVYRMLHQDGYPMPEGTRGCLAGRSYLRIDPEGNITPCPYMPLTVGNVKEKSLASIWEESPVLRQMRSGVYQGRCGTCEYGEICGGCRARALVKKNDVMEEDPLCTYEPSGKDAITLDDVLKTDLFWEKTARERVKKIPLFMRGMITRVIETKARERGVAVITSEFIDEIKMKGYPDMHRNHQG